MRDLLNRVIVGDAIEVCKQIPDHSIHLVVTDPPYPVEYLFLYEWLGKELPRLLIPGGYAFIYCGVSYLPEIFNYLVSGNMKFHWLLTLLNRGEAVSQFRRRIFAGAKHVLMLTNGEPRFTKWIYSVFDTGKDKRFHKWGQSVTFPLYIIDRFSQTGEIVLDPFCGGGSVPLAAKLTGRNFITIEIDAKTAEIANSRISSIDPLFTEIGTVSDSWEISRHNSNQGVKLFKALI